jgi:hypothetical protein
MLEKTFLFQVHRPVFLYPVLMITCGLDLEVIGSASSGNDFNDEGRTAGKVFRFKVC